jgi:hypothetical protein
MPLQIKQLRKNALVAGNNSVNYLQPLLELVIDTHWSNETLKKILSETDEGERYKLITTWRDNRLADLDRINLIVCNFTQ